MIEKLPQFRNDCGIARPKPAISSAQTSSTATRSNRRAKWTLRPGPGGASEVSILLASAMGQFPAAGARGRLLAVVCAD